MKNVTTKSKLEAIIAYDERKNFNHAALKAASEKEINEFYETLTNNLAPGEVEKLARLASEVAAPLAGVAVERISRKNLSQVSGENRVLRNKVDALINIIKGGELSQYEVCKANNMSIRTLARYVAQGNEIDNMRLSTVESLASYYDNYIANKMSCTTCGKVMSEGYLNEEHVEFYCSKDCTPEDAEQMLDDEIIFWTNF